jgi:hypothetical protein
MFDPAPNLPDDTLIEMVRFSPSIRKSLNAAGLKTIGEIRAMSDDRLRIMQGVGPGSFAHLRTTIGLKSNGEYPSLLALHISMPETAKWNCIPSRSPIAANSVGAKLRHSSAIHHPRVGRPDMRPREKNTNCGAQTPHGEQRDPAVTLLTGYPLSPSIADWQKRGFVDKLGIGRDCHAQFESRSRYLH